MITTLPFFWSPWFMPFLFFLNSSLKVLSVGSESFWYPNPLVHSPGVGECDLLPVLLGFLLTGLLLPISHLHLSLHTITRFTVLIMLIKIIN